MESLLVAILVIIILLVVAAIVAIFFIPSLHQPIVKAFKRRFGTSRMESMRDIKNLSEQLADALYRLSIDKIGALITIERKAILDEYRDIGFRLSCKFSPELVFSIFYNKRSPLHDGAIIVKDAQIASVSSYYPTSTQSLDINYGARHRAALGLSEITDAVTYVVSETTGQISVAKGGKLNVLPKELETLKTAIFQSLVEVPTQKAV